MKQKKILIVGGVAGGASAAARLRRLDEKAQIILFEKGNYISFANCGLPYYIGGEIKEKSALTLQTPESFHDRFGVDVRVCHQVMSIHPKEKTVTVKDLEGDKTYTESYDSLILSPGAEPIKPPIPGVDSSRVFTLRNIPDTYKIKDYMTTHQPQTVTIVGGGYIGVEMAENLHLAGLSVTLVEMQNQVIAPLDVDMACEVQQHLRSKGITLLLGNAVKKIEENDHALTVELNQGQFETDFLILAIGVQPETALAKKAGIKTNHRGAIIVSKQMVTSNPNIYAVGDAVEVTDFVSGEQTSIPLAGPANKQGRIAADNVCGGNSSYTGTQGSSILKVFDLTVATTGMNEKTAIRLNKAYDKSFTYSANHAGYYPGAVNMSIKTIFEPETGKILGAQIIGFDGVDKRCDVFATAIRFGATASDLTKLELCYAPPYSSAKDPVNMAGFVIENLLNQKVNHFHWDKVKDLPQDESVIKLDVRTKLEYDNGHIDGFINIPVDSMRKHLDQLDVKKPVYVTCQVGLRGYVACRILSQQGFQCYNLSGGYRLYHTIVGDLQTMEKSALPSSPKHTKETVQNQYVAQKAQEATAKQKQHQVSMNVTDGTQPPLPKGQTIAVDACGLQCPGPIIKLSEALKQVQVGDVIQICTTDIAFSSDVEGYCRRTGHCFEGIESKKGTWVARIRKGYGASEEIATTEKNGKNFIIFSGDLDKAIASFIMANASAALGRRTSMFFTFWGLNILRRSENLKTDKDVVSRLFGCMMPRGSKKLKLSKMNMGGIGAKMIREIMKNKNVESLEDLMKLAQQNGVELIACSMSMDVMGITQEELIDGVKLGGAAAMLAHAEESDMSLFI